MGTRDEARRLLDALTKNDLTSGSIAISEMAWCATTNAGLCTD